MIKCKEIKLMLLYFKMMSFYWVFKFQRNQIQSCLIIMLKHCDPDVFISGIKMIKYSDFHLNIETFSYSFID